MDAIQQIRGTDSSGRASSKESKGGQMKGNMDRRDSIRNNVGILAMGKR